MKHLVVLGTAALCLFAVARSWADDAAAPASAPVAAPEPDLATKGRSFYASHCSHCHGFNKVNPGNYSFDLRKFPHDAKDRFVNSVMNGKNGRMPPWKDVVTTDDLDAVWAYILTGGKS